MSSKVSFLTPLRSVPSSSPARLRATSSPFRMTAVASWLVFLPAASRPHPTHSHHCYQQHGRGGPFLKSNHSTLALVQFFTCCLSPRKRPKEEAKDPGDSPEHAPCSQASVRIPVLHLLLDKFLNIAEFHFPVHKMQVKICIVGLSGFNETMYVEVLCT